MKIVNIEFEDGTKYTTIVPNNFDSVKLQDDAKKIHAMVKDADNQDAIRQIVDKLVEKKIFPEDQLDRAFKKFGYSMDTLNTLAEIAYNKKTVLELI